MDYCTDPLIRVTTPNSTRSDFSHDGKMRRRVRVEYTWVGGAWVTKSSESFWHGTDGNLRSDSVWTNASNGENRLLALESAAGVSTGAKMREVWKHLPEHRLVQMELALQLRGGEPLKITGRKVGFAAYGAHIYTTLPAWLAWSEDCEPVHEPLNERYHDWRWSGLKGGSF